MTKIKFKAEELLKPEIEKRKFIQKVTEERKNLEKTYYNYLF